MKNIKRSKLKTKSRFRLVGIFAAIVLVLTASFLYARQPKIASIAFTQTANQESVGSNVSQSSTPASSAAAKNNTPASSSSATGSSSVTNSSSSTHTSAPAQVATQSVPAAIAVPPSSQLYTDPSSDVAVQSEAWAANNPSNATAMNRLAATPMAGWFGDFSGSNIQAVVNTYVGNAAALGQIPVLVAYNIPERDCGGYSGGGAGSSAAYQSWITSFAEGIGDRQSIVIVEPDALSGMDCLSSGDQQSRLQLIAYAVQTLRANTNAAIYIDAGNPTWQSASVMANRLSAADVAQATGFSLNVSNFQTTSSNVNYGEAISNMVGGKHFVIDTSRNGNGVGAGGSCNPDGVAFGSGPTFNTGNSLVDAYLWIKDPGESDGTCGIDQLGTSAPSAGAWWPQYAIMLENNSNW